MSKTLLIVGLLAAAAWFLSQKEERALKEERLATAGYLVPGTAAELQAMYPDGYIQKYGETEVRVDPSAYAWLVQMGFAVPKG